ncbi:MULTISPECIES: TraR/DksA family transcriptional regulator [Sneathiella]|jgi:DnaK suppressor protein|uniref:TraR/DksA family transcriptional regulator n=1 Tax=Sneathiella TaxID=510690 RepID=UPI00146F0ED3|nr:TraR/DksA C4-type zinc finger protein [Sneathiella aquimaris]
MLDVAAIEQELKLRLSTLKDRVTEMETTLRQEHSANFHEQATEREDEEVVERLEQDALVEIQAIENALRNIANGRYGLCTECDAPIGEQRLKVLPYASRCIQCAS